MRHKKDAEKTCAAALVLTSLTRRMTSAWTYELLGRRALWPCATSLFKSRQRTQLNMYKWGFGAPCRLDRLPSASMGKKGNQHLGAIKKHPTTSLVIASPFSESLCPTNLCCCLHTIPHCFFCSYNWGSLFEYGRWGLFVELRFCGSVELLHSRLAPAEFRRHSLSRGTTASFGIRYKKQKKTFEFMLVTLSLVMVGMEQIDGP